MLVGTLDIHRKLDEEARGRVVISRQSEFEYRRMVEQEVRVRKLEGARPEILPPEGWPMESLEDARSRLAQSREDSVADMAKRRKQDFGGSREAHERLVRASIREVRAALAL